MKSEKILYAIGKINDELIEDAAIVPGTVKRNIPWLKLAALAACLCLIIGLTIPNFIDFQPNPGGGVISPGGNVLPGSLPDDIDPIIASIAVYPATEQLQNVQNATIDDIAENEAYAYEKLGNYLPDHLPDGYSFGRGSIYETTMKDGTKYHMLRVIYSTVEMNEQIPTSSDTGELSIDTSGVLAGDSFLVFIMDYKPDTEQKIYDSTEAAEYISKMTDNGVFIISYDEVYIGFAPLSLTSSEIMDIFNSID